MTAIEQGIITPTTKERLLELESKKADLEILIEQAKLDMPIALTVDGVYFWFKKFIDGDPSDENFQEQIIDAFVNKVVLFNDKIIITWNTKDENNEKLTAEQLIMDFESEKPLELTYSVNPKGSTRNCLVTLPGIEPGLPP